MTPATSSERYDVIVVGARVAGASLACLLARGGARVLALDRDVLPSEYVASTHALHPAGVRVLDHLGVGEALRASTPELSTLRIVRGSGSIDVGFQPGLGEYCPRRESLDGWLQQAAVRAGAVLRDRCPVVGLVQTAGRVAGVEVRDGRGTRRLLADLVVGADGRSSSVARWVGAGEYLDYPAERGAYWSYFPAPAGYGRSEAFPAGMYVANADGWMRMAFHTQDDQVLVGCLPELADLPRFRADPLGALRASLRRDPLLEAFARAEPAVKVRGVLPGRYFLRPAAGPGWALLGDAGVHQEFAAGDGMSSALIHAGLLARAVLEQSPLEEFWARRDVDVLPRYFFGKIQGAAGDPSELDALVLARAASQPRLRRRLARSLEHELTPFDVVGPAQVARWVLPELLRGRLGLASQLLRRGRYLGRVRELVRRQLESPSASLVWEERRAGASERWLRAPAR